MTKLTGVSTAKMTVALPNNVHGKPVAASWLLQWLALPVKWHFGTIIC